jgi:hypothetical protein
MPEIVNKAQFAARAGVDPSTVSTWIRTGKLTAPAITPENRVDVALGLAQIAQTVAPRMASERAASPDLVRAAMLSGLFGSFEANFFPPVVARLGLTQQQRGMLARCWYDFRVRASRE